MPFAYPYVGPERLRLDAREAPPGRRITSLALLEQAEEVSTFVVGLDGVLRLAPRRSEHIACAGAPEVLAAGELHLVRAPNGLRVVSVSNQSTGFCPSVESWPEVQAALSFEGLVLPRAFTHAIEFRRCVQCREVNIVKESWFVCVFCDAALPLEWNVSARRPIQK